MKNHEDTSLFARLSGTWVIESLGLVGLFLISFIPRAIEPISRPLQWYSRSVRFWDAIIVHDWATTYQRYHPGVITMWLSGLGIKIYSWMNGISSAQLLGNEASKPGVVANAINAGVVPLALAISLGILLAFVFISRLWGKPVAWIAAGLLALDPFFITYSKVLHVDALLAVFVLLSMLCLLLALQRDAIVLVVVSGLLGGLALLTKTPALFLVLYAPFAVGIAALWEKPRSFRRMGKKVVVWTFIWLVAAVVTFFTLWPAMWVSPGLSLGKIIDSLFFHVDTVHRNPVFFNGTAAIMDPGALFYLATIAYKLTELTLPMIVIGIVWAVVTLREKNSRQIILMFSGAVFYFCQMSLGARKEQPYILPVFLMLDLVAAWAIVRILRFVSCSKTKFARKKILLITSIILMIIPMILIINRHPYYGTYHNLLLGGPSKAAQILPLQDQGEGLDRVARYLNTLPGAQRASAGIHPRGAAIFTRHFIGLTNAINDPDANFRVYFINQIMRGLGSEEWEQSWLRDQKTEPLFSVEFDGIPYAWVYGESPEEPVPMGPEFTMGFDFGEHIHLNRVRINNDDLGNREILTIVFFWTSDGNIEQSYKVFCHILSTEGEIVAQNDGIPLQGIRPTSTWIDGEEMIDIYEIQLSREIPNGDYVLAVGMYDPDTGERVPIFQKGGTHRENRIDVANISITAKDDSEQ